MPAQKKINWDDQITFGQYKGEILRERFPQDPSYFRWYFHKDPSNIDKFTTGALAAMVCLDWDHRELLSVDPTIGARACSIICAGFCQYICKTPFDDEITNILCRIRELYDETYPFPMLDWLAQSKEGSIVIGVGTVELTSITHVDLWNTISANTMRHKINRVVERNKKTDEWVQRVESRQASKAEYYETRGIAYGDW